MLNRPKICLLHDISHVAILPTYANTFLCQFYGIRVLYRHDKETAMWPAFLTVPKSEAWSLSNHSESCYYQFFVICVCLTTPRCCLYAADYSCKFMPLFTAFYWGTDEQVKDTRWNIRSLARQFEAFGVLNRKITLKELCVCLCVCCGGGWCRGVWEEEHLPGTNPALASHFSLENLSFIKLQ